MASRTKKAPEPAAKEVSKPFQRPPTVSRRELLEKGSDHRFRQFLYDLSLLSTHQERVRRHCAEQLDITSPQFNILMVIAEYQGECGVSVGMVAEHLHVTDAFITMEVGKLARKQLVLKLPNPNDGRGIQLSLSDAGEVAVVSISPYLRLINDRFFGSLTQEEFRGLSDCFSKMIEAAVATVEWLPVARRSFYGKEASVGRETSARVAPSERP